MGSVKKTITIREPTEDLLGRGIFATSNNYSVFDWKEMPDKIPNKGAVLCMMAAANFEDIIEKEVETHYMGIREGSKLFKSISQLSKPSNEIDIRLAEVMKPVFRRGSYDYRNFQSKRGNGNFVVPLEIMYRNGVTEGSSYLKKLRKLESEGKTRELAQELDEIELDHIPIPGEIFPKRKYDFTTKFESSDRPVTYEEARKISGLTDKQWGRMVEVRGIAADVVSERAKKAGMVDYDGKLEFLAFYDTLMLADFFGTFDENRLTFNGIQVSKEVLRQWYKKTQPDWVEQIEAGKEQAKKDKTDNWKQYVSLKPKPLPPQLIELVREMYAAGANQYLGKGWFRARDLDRVMNDLGRYSS